MEGCEFLRLVAGAYAHNEGASVGDKTFVFPNRRSLIFFQKYLGEEYGKLYGKPLLSPQMLTISELFASISGLELADPIEVQYILYKNYIRLKYPELDQALAMERESFDEFLHWGNVMVSDFNDIDKYLIDASQLFTNIKDLKELDSDYSFLTESQRRAVEKFWSSFLNGGVSFKKESFSQLWNLMYDLYISFKSELEAANCGYEGMIYRKVAENPQMCSYSQLVFIGFNAPNKCERKLMKWLRESGRGDFYWDFYGPMVTDPLNKASMFISEAVKEFPSKYKIESEHQCARIFAVGVPSGVGQAFVAADILKGIAGSNPIRSAVVLPDEKLLLPLLDSIPEEYGKVNVTMGYPISATPLTGFVNLVVQLQRSVKIKGNKCSFYSRTLLELLKHNYIKEQASDEALKISDYIVKANLIYIPLDMEFVSKVESTLLKSLFAVPGDSAEMLDYITAILKELDLFSSPLDKEFIYRYYLAILRLKNLNIPMRKETCLKLLVQITSSIAVPFNGEPLAGLQVVGSLEVRALDFENIIILSVNEGTFPASSQSNSFIPYNLRVGFGLPTYELQDAIAAYHFYRSIYRAKNVWLLYDTRSDGLKSGEVSRFIKQLEYHYNIPIERSIVATSVISSGDKVSIEVRKGPQVMQRMIDAYLKEEGGKSLSASAINTYLNCPLQFYLNYVMGIREEEDVEESIEASTFGTIFHDTMEELYSKYVGELISDAIIDSIMKERQRLDEVIEAKFKKSRIAEIVGKNVIVKEVIRRCVMITLEEDKKYTPFHYIGGEETFYSRLRLSDGRSVRFKAVIDRIDSTDNSLRVVDYKTGKVEKPSANTSIDSYFERDKGKQYKAFVQLYLYAMVLDTLAGECGFLKLKSGKKVNFVCSDDSSNIDMAVYPVTKLKKEPILLQHMTRENLDIYKAALTRCVEEIFNEDIPFMQAEEGNRSCSWCIFKQICRR